MSRFTAKRGAEGLAPTLGYSDLLPKRKATVTRMTEHIGSEAVEAVNREMEEEQRDIWESEQELMLQNVKDRAAQQVELSGWEMPGFVDEIAQMRQQLEQGEQ
jgi:hypothetical protein